MTSRHDAKAKLLLGNLSVRMLSGALDSMAYGETNDDKHADGMIALIVEALRAEREAAFEECSTWLVANPWREMKVAFCTEPSGPYFEAFLQGPNGSAPIRGATAEEAIAAAIRAAKEKLP